MDQDRKRSTVKKEKKMENPSENTVTRIERTNKLLMYTVIIEVVILGLILVLII
ncbi:MAG: hypothetical protein ABR909_07220 [Candidatus Bathyarchaeia archaeon]